MLMVTGVKGFVGGRLVQVYGNKENVIGIDLHPSKASEALSRYLAIDLSRKNAVDELNMLDQADAIVHTAAIISPLKCQTEPVAAYTTNIIGTLNMLEYARLKDVKKFVYISTGGIYKNSDSTDLVTEDWPVVPRGIYSISKVSAENTVKDFSKNYGIDAAALRITAPYGPRMYDPRIQKSIPDSLHRHTLLFALSCVRGEDIIMKAGGDHTVNYTYIDDIVNGIILALKTKIGGFEIFNLAGGKNYRIADLGEAVKRICPRIKIEIGGGDLLNAPEGNDSMNSLLPIKQGLFDVSKAERILGFKPKFGLGDGMRNLISYFSEILKAS